MEKRLAIEKESNFRLCEDKKCKYGICPWDERHIPGRNSFKISLCNEGTLENISVTDLETIELYSLS